MLTHFRDGLSSGAVRAANWRSFRAWFRHELPKEVIRGILGLTPPRPIDPPGAYHARDRFGRWETRVPASSALEPTPDRWAR